MKGKGKRKGERERGKARVKGNRKRKGGKGKGERERRKGEGKKTDHRKEKRQNHRMNILALNRLKSQKYTDYFFITHL